MDLAKGLAGETLQTSPKETTMGAKVKAYREYVLETYPDAFDYENPKPLKIGVGKDLLRVRPGWVTHKVVGRFMHRWTRRRVYKQQIALGGHRYGLDGRPAGEVSAEHQSLAADEAKKR